MPVRDISKSDGLCGSLFEPHSDWIPPKLPEHLDQCPTIGIDVESRDPNLQERGPGFLRGDAEVVGVGLSNGVDRWYLPIAHMSGGNMDRGVVVRFLKRLAKRPRTWVGANIQYELEALDSLGIELSGTFRDVQVTEALIDEEQDSYSLEVLCQKYLGRGKEEAHLERTAREFGVDPKSGLWKLHSRHVGPYAEMDPLLTMQVDIAQHEAIAKSGEELGTIIGMESEIIPIIWKMRRQGIRVDLDRATKLSKKLKQAEDELHLQLWRDHDVRGLDIWSGEKISRLCDLRKIPYPRTQKGNPSFEGDWLEESKSPLLSLIARIRVVNRLRTVFVDQWIFGNHRDGVIHPEWKQLRADEGGTRTGRMAAANPNPQQIPARSDLAPQVRELFVPHHGRWAKYDYSQQEPRLAVHYADRLGLTGASLTRMAYVENPKMDIYQFLAEAAGISRRQSKDLTLGRFYGMGKRKLATKLGVSVDEAGSLLQKFDEGVPYIKELSDICARMASKRGWIRTVCGRHRHFTYWEPADAYDRKKAGEHVRPLKLKEAQEKWPDVKLVRANTHKALNSLIQGSAADMTKMAMIRVYQEKRQVPIMQVHDELNYSTEPVKEPEEILEIMESSVKLTVPMRVDMHIGEHWR